MPQVPKSHCLLFVVGNKMDLSIYEMALPARIEHLQRHLTDEEQKKYYRLNSFINIWFACTGGSFDINEHTDFFSKTSTYALRQIDAVFFTKFGQHIEQHAFQLEMTDNEWQNGIKPASH